MLYIPMIEGHGLLEITQVWDTPDLERYVRRCANCGGRCCRTTNVNYGQMEVDAADFALALREQVMPEWIDALVHALNGGDVALTIDLTEVDEEENDDAYHD